MRNGLVAGVLALGLWINMAGAQSLPASALATSSQPATTSQLATLPVLTTAPTPAKTPVALIITADNDAATTAAAEKLSSLLPEIKAEQVTLRAFTDTLRTGLKLNVAVNWADLKTAGATQDTLLDFSLQNVSADEALRTALDLAAPAKLDYVISEGVVEIGTRQRLARQALIRTWVPKPLLEKALHAPPASSAATQPDVPGRELADLFRAMVTPSLWADKTHAVHYMAHELIITGPARTQWEAAGLFQDLLKPIKVPADKGGKLDLPPRLKETPAYQAAREKLTAGRIELRTNGLQLQDALPALARSLQPVPLVAHWRALAAAGLKPDTPLTLNIPADSPAKGLAAVLAAATPEGASPPVLDLSPEGVLHVTTAEGKPSRDVLAVFDLRDLIRRRIYQATGPQKPTTRQVAADLVAAVQKAGEAAGWSKRARWQEWEGLLVVRAAPEVQRAVAAVLARQGR